MLDDLNKWTKNEVLNLHLYTVLFFGLLDTEKSDCFCFVSHLCVCLNRWKLKHFGI
uniref:Uncharacterized protein n=1 Tax=Rhizophora mucronata TaxID=61149 RepID=A0A2P2KV59_RHIMU